MKQIIETRSPQAHSPAISPARMWGRAFQSSDFQQKLTLMGIKKNFFFIEIKLIYNVLLISSVQEHNSGIYTLLHYGLSQDIVPCAI